METRHIGDYGRERKVTREEATEQITHAQEFVDLAERLLSQLPPSIPSD